MDLDLTTVATYQNSAEAQIARMRLAQAGIPCNLENDQVVATDWHVSTAVGGVRVKVAAADVEAARHALTPVTDDAAGHEPRFCEQCGRPLEPGFDVCWACAASEQISENVSDGSIAAPLDPLLEYEDDQFAGGQRDAADHEVADRDDADGEDHYDPAQAAVDALAWRALRAAIFSAFLPVVLNAYSLLLLVRVANTDTPLSHRGRWFVLGAWVANLFVVGCLALVWWASAHVPFDGA